MPRKNNDQKFGAEDMNNIFKRLGSLEQENASISADIKNLAHGFENLVGEVRSMKRDHRTNWGVLASWASVIVAIMVYHSSLAIAPIKTQADFDREEILRIRAWKDNVEQTIPAMQKDIIWLEKLIQMKSVDRYTRSEAIKDLNSLRKEMLLIHKTPKTAVIP